MNTPPPNSSRTVAAFTTLRHTPFEACYSAWANTWRLWQYIGECDEQGNREKSWVQIGADKITLWREMRNGEVLEP